MSLLPPDREHIRDMLEWAGKGQRFVAGLSEDQFLQDERAQSAVLHALMVIGEAAARVSSDTHAAHPEIPWREIRGMRNRIAHDYVGVDIDEVWRTVAVDLPALTMALETALARL